MPLTDILYLAAVLAFFLEFGLALAYAERSTNGRR